MQRFARLPFADCKDKWKNVRNNFVRSLKEPPSGSSAKAKKPYYLHDILQFMLPYVRTVQHSEKNNSNILLSDMDISTEIEETDTEQNTSNSVFQPAKRNLPTECTSNLRKKKKAGNGEEEIAGAVLQIVKERQDKKGPYEGRRLFLMSLLSDVEKMTEEDYTEFRIYCLTGIQKFMRNSTNNFNLISSSSGSVVSTPASSPNEIKLFPNST
ncbi:uncharacterized protein LOC118734394, partial [Rhagoletis pomonella]|uniref:uncharacterized protein LOC118734394 n=1 Tax=Rhagoletis pomonella TaxID=28610 RepID=UPI001782B27F